MYNKPEIHILVQEGNESGNDFASRITDLMTILYSNDPNLQTEFQFTSSSNGRQTCNIIIR